MRQLKRAKGKTIIPKGCYCYDENGQCPYWDCDERKPEQYNGFCWYMEKGDMDLAKEKTFIEEETGEKIQGQNMPVPVSLLWDACKECGENDTDYDIFGP